MHFCYQEKTFKRNLKPVFGPTKKSQIKWTKKIQFRNINEVNAQFHEKKNIISYFQNVLGIFPSNKKKFLSFT